MDHLIVNWAARTKIVEPPIESIIAYLEGKINWRQMENVKIKDQNDRLKFKMRKRYKMQDTRYKRKDTRNKKQIKFHTFSHSVIDSKLEFQNSKFIFIRFFPVNSQNILHISSYLTVV